MKHPARTIPYKDLYEGLEDNVRDGYIRKQVQGDLAQYTYTEKCTYEKAWNEYTMLARGLILDTRQAKVVATPFPKFFNIGELEQIPSLPFETFEKLDGSLIIGYWYGHNWDTATKGSFMSPQARWAYTEMSKITPMMLPGLTYLFEAVYPENRIVVNYRYSGLFLLAIYDINGAEVTYDSMQEWCAKANIRLALRFKYDNIAELIATAKKLPASEEGFVLRFTDGTRVKIKGDEYCRIHKLISNITPLAIWEMMWKGDDLETWRKQIPEEFHKDFDQIEDILKTNHRKLVQAVLDKAEQLAPLTNKQIGLMLHELPEHIRPFIFAARRSLAWDREGKTKDTLWRALRPDSNRLEGYEPTSAMNKVAEEDL